MSNQKIAIIGVSGKYPDADCIDDLWENLKQGKDAITEVPKERWNHELYFQADERVYGKSYSKWGGFINDVDKFDPLFFNIAPGVAELLDPQERLFLQCAYHTVEDAGYSYERLSDRGSVGVFSAVEYSEYVMYSQANTPVSALNASISNRVSYFCNFTGPSITIDTMCSGSISTVHLACQSISNGECSAAIAGGVNLTLHPNKFILHTAGRYSSTTGRCRSFGENATGYVASEGVGAVLLKPLQHAIEDGDHIYAVVRSTAINHGGMSRTYTVPKASSQAAVIRDALEKNNIDPVSYIEAHGSGTAIGDVIEIDGLQRAYGEAHLVKDDTDKPACLVGSIKSNIGHCESASGIAGLTKVLLQLRYKTIVPSIHSEPTNQYIDFVNSPFSVAQRKQPWTVPEGKKRVAGISAFGAGGANAHMLVEEYIGQKKIDSMEAESKSQEGKPHYILLSAKNQERLSASLHLLLKAIQRTGDSLYESQDIRSIAYTLQVGRKHHEQRLAIKVASINELSQILVSLLDKGLESETDKARVWRGEVIKGKPLKSYIEENQGTYTDFINEQDESRLIPLWLSGYPVNWDALYTAERPHRVSLPGYPFALQRCWVPNTDLARTYPPLEVLENLDSHREEIQSHSDVVNSPSYMQPLKLSLSLTGEEYFIAQHVVNGVRIFPGVAYLEIVREGVMQILPGNTTFSLKNVVWRRPMMFEQDYSDKDIQVEFSNVPIQDESGKYKSISFKIYDKNELDEGDFCRGYVQIEVAENVQDAPPVFQDFTDLLAQSSLLDVEKETFYKLFNDAGLSYGEAMRGVESLRRGDEYIFGQVKLQEKATRSHAQAFQSMQWYPEILDSALHCILAGYIDGGNHASNGSVGPAVPFALGSVIQYSSLPESVWVVLQIPESNKSIQSVDLFLCDSVGNICLQMTGYASRVLKKSVEKGKTSPSIKELGNASTTDIGEATDMAKVRLFIPSWEVSPVVQRIHSSMENYWVLLLGNASRWESQIQAYLPTIRVISLASDNHQDIGLDHRSYAQQASKILNVLQDALRDKENKPGSLQMVMTSEDDQSIYAGLFGMLRTACHEHVIKFGNLIETDSVDLLLQQLATNCEAKATGVVRLTSQGRLSRYWKIMPNHTEEMAGLQETNKSVLPWKEGGVYLLTGGFGGLGQIFINEILTKTESCIIVVWGRGELTDEKKSFLDKYNSTKSNASTPAVQFTRVFYQSVDVTDVEQVDKAVNYILDEHGQLNGILHAAGVLQDGMIVKKSPEQLEKVLLPKVQGVMNLERATQDCALDFFVLFSSISGALGAAGQADYSAANGYLDGFSSYRNRLVTQGKRSGKTLSINWPLWQDGGMKMQRHALRALKESSGQTPLPAEVGLKAFYTLLGSMLDTDMSQVLVLHGEGEAYRAFYESLQAPKQLTVDNSRSYIEAQKQKVSEDDILRAISELLKIDESSIDSDTEFFDIGFDSVTISELAGVIGEMMGRELSPTVFYECTSTRELLSYLDRSNGEDSLIVEALDNNNEQISEPFVENVTPISQQNIVTITEASVVEIISELLKVPTSSIDVGTEFFDIGFDSVTISELASRIEEVYGIEVSPMLFYEHQSVGELLSVLNKSTVNELTTIVSAHNVEVVSNISSENAKQAEGNLQENDNQELQVAEKEIVNELVQTIGGMLKIRPSDIDIESELSQLGFDSVSFAELAQELSQNYAVDLSPTVFYEYETVSLLATHIADLGATEKGLCAETALEVEVNDKGAITNSKTTAGMHKAVHDGATLIDRTYNATGVESSQKKHEAIAVIGMNGRFPGASNLEQFWDNLVNGKDCITEVPEFRWDWKKVYGDPKKNGLFTQSKWGGFVEHIDRFDAEFFGIAPYEARQMDPQQRILLESAWHAIEDAGYSADALAGSNTGVYIGIAHTSGYGSVQKQAIGHSESSTELSAPINAPSLGPNRISYFFNFKGPSEPIETACSSSLVAIHRAVNSLRIGECDLCLAGGVNVMVTESGHVSMSRAGLLSNDGKCKTFSSEADGYVRSEGVGILVLKPVSDAERDGDNIIAVIRNTKVGYSGKGSAFSAPNTNSQALLIRACYEEQGIDASRVSYIEAQGTGTEIGDAVEFQAIQKAFRNQFPQDARHACAVASVKTHIGHLEVASGMASMMKVLLQIRHEQIVANLHFDTVNSHINIDESPFFIPKSVTKWTRSDIHHQADIPKLAGINAFGFGGVNAHVILEEYCGSLQSTDTSRSEQQQIAVLLSAKSEKQIQIQAGNLLSTIRNNPHLQLYNIAYTLQVGRRAMEERVGFIVPSREECIVKLEQIASGNFKASQCHRGTVSSNSQVISILQSDSSMQDVIHEWLRVRNVDMLTSLWAKGLSVDWLKMYEGERVLRVSLPGYPFKPVRHWIGELPDVDDTQAKKTRNEVQTLKALANDETDLKKRLLAIFQDVVTDTENLTVMDELAGVDISSLEIFMLSQRIQDVLNLDVSVEELAASHSINDLSLRIASGIDTPEVEAMQGIVKLSHRQSGTESSSPALICVPAAGAMLTSFYPLAAQMGELVCLYGFGHRGISGTANPHNSIKEMAQEYVSKIPILDENKTVYLLGHSLGASVVYEMACMLRNKGYSVHIFMLDSQLYAEGGLSLPHYFRFFVQNEHAADAIAQCRIRGEDAHKELKKALINDIASGNVQIRESNDNLENLMSVYAHQILMGLDYVPSQKYDGEVTLLFAEEGDIVGDNLQKTLGKYNRYCLGEIHTATVKGGHYSVLAKSNVADLADNLLLSIVPEALERFESAQHKSSNLQSNKSALNKGSSSEASLGGSSYESE